MFDPHVLLPCSKANIDMPIHVLIFDSYFESIKTSYWEKEHMAIMPKMIKIEGRKMQFHHKFIYWLTKETLQTFFANGSNRNVEMGYLLFSNKWITATMLFASSIIVVYDWRFMRWCHLLKQHLMPLRLITWPILMQTVFHALFHESW